jgi:8-hydroxy-5-deazaflavin:NADPH oxidoreductase
MTTTLTIIGAGNMGRGIASVAARGGNTVTIIDHKPEDAASLASELQSQYPNATVKPGSLEEPLGDIIVFAVWYTAAQDLARQLSDQLSGKVVVDISNPVTQTYDALAISGDTSAAEELERLIPNARVVKAFNTNFAGTLVAGQVVDVLIAGNDQEAKATLVEVVNAGGLKGIRRGTARARPHPRGARVPRHPVAVHAGHEFRQHLEVPRLTFRHLR